jgi:DNA-binding NarL/FixJ family response regulator
MPQIEVVKQVDDTASALKMIADDPLTLVLLDLNLPEHPIQTVLNLTRAEWPQTRCIVLADNIQQHKMATDNGADDVLLSGFPATKLFTTVERLLSGQEASVL